jgi:hypothetical protein
MLTGAWMVMSLVSARNIPLFAIVSGPILACACTDWIQGKTGGRAFISKFLDLDHRLLAIESTMRGVVWPVLGVIAAVLMFFAGIPIDSRRQGNQFDPQVFPVAAAQWLEDHPQTRPVFNYFPWGGYLLYREWPATRVFIDGQTDFYGEALTREYETVLSMADGWQNVLSKYQVSWVIFPVESSLVTRLSMDPAWLVVYQDTTTAILRRK